MVIKIREEMDVCKDGKQRGKRRNMTNTKQT